jgi:hypothetical protein
MARYLHYSQLGLRDPLVIGTRAMTHRLVAGVCVSIKQTAVPENSVALEPPVTWLAV